MTEIMESYPECGQMVFVRQRPAIVQEVTTKQDNPGATTLHLVEIEYLDGWNFPKEDSLIWEREISPRIISRVKLPEITPGSQPDLPSRYHAFVNAIRWSTLNRIQLGASGQDSNYNYRLTSPYYSAVQIEDYQLYPVIKALQMPRVRLLLADDVGLGKTIEAGLIVTELINQRRIRRILIISPASIQVQWKEEMAEKFNLSFKLINRDETFKLQKELGMDTNAWRTVPRVITSMDYISQSNIFDQFRAAAEKLLEDEQASLPWDLIIVDEAHNFMPSVRGPKYDSQRSKMLREICKFFEHRLFLTATPHNGFTPSFSGLLEILDPLRFSQKPVLDEKDHKQIKLAMIRRLKSELNQRKLVKRFSDRFVEALEIKLSQEEKELFHAFRQYRKVLLKELKKIGLREVVIGKFVFSLLKKRLLSSTYAFARTWWIHVQGFQLEGLGIAEAEKSKSLAETDSQDDSEKDVRENDAVRHGAACFKSIASEVEPSLKLISTLLEKVGYGPKIHEKTLLGLKLTNQDAKLDALISWIQNKLFTGKLANQERLVIFTEYRDTQNYLVQRLSTLGWNEPALKILFGGASTDYREQIKAEFNNPDSKLRILIATDTASEGLNLHQACRYIIHQDIPWNPMRLEQRNGRLDRYGQWEDVFIHHFVSNEDEDLKFLDYIVKKTNIIRDDLGSAGKVLDAALMRYFEGEEDDLSVDEKTLDKEIDPLTHAITAQESKSIYDTGNDEQYETALKVLEKTKKMLSITPDHLFHVLNESLKIESSNAELRAFNNPKSPVPYYRFSPSPKTWEALIDQHLKIHHGVLKDTLPNMFFDDSAFQVKRADKMIYQIPKDSSLIRIGHPLIQRSLSIFKRFLWDPNDNLHRWTIQKAELPLGMEALGIVSYIINIRNHLDELVDSSVENLYFQIAKGSHSEISDSGQIDTIENQSRSDLDNSEVTQWRSILSAEWSSLRDWITSQLTQIQTRKQEDVLHIFAQMLKDEIKNEKNLLQQRIKELENEDQYAKDIEKYDKEIESLRSVIAQSSLGAYIADIVDPNEERKRQIKSLEEKKADLNWKRETSTVELLKAHLQNEFDRISTKILPQRYNLKNITIFPIGIEFLINT